MSNLVILPILLPLLTGIFLVFFNSKLPLVRMITKVMVIINLIAVSAIAYEVVQNGTMVLKAGDWTVPYGIVLVADPLAMVLVVTANIVATACAFYAFHSLDEQRERFYFYPLFQLLIAGVSGAFLTGDLFNLFVFFEVLLIASYGLIVLGGTKEQFRESFKYIIINLFSSILFVTTVSFLYAVVGTVNMAQLAERVGEVEQGGILTTIAILLLVVFATKGALFPLYFWLPKSYTVPPTVISALFGALLTKVGVYSILRVFSLIFVYDLTFTHQLFIILAAFTLIFGVVGALSTNNIQLIVAYNIIPAVGYMILGIGVFSATALAGSVYYLVHDMIIKAALFLLVGAMAAYSGTSDLRKMGGLIKHQPVLGWLFFIAALALAGLPPFSGFVGKLLILRGAFEEGHYTVAVIGLLTSLLILISIIKIFIKGFWGEDKLEKVPNISIRNKIMPAAFLLFFTVLLGIGAEFFYPTVQSIGDQIIDPINYIDSVMKE
ncbi:Na+/H+ antiporter subunit D [Guptibacillus algicola]|uniref:Na+/H+ antiporter subunit D n=1 Tax=Guptibacillus algicola TaxID=225844 RepID=UPI001CD27860|nr:Na+/H+ antiporter subunit D [Alkalihalobacillus algicola]MCA0986127.1 Na+/H+ antiporter subunit D [Alkalihalobacillus algicola]